MKKFLTHLMYLGIGILFITVIIGALVGCYFLVSRWFSVTSMIIGGVILFFVCYSIGKSFYHEVIKDE